MSMMRVLTHILAIEDGVQLNQWTPATLTWARSDAGVPEPEPASVTDAWAWLGSPSCGAPRDSFGQAGSLIRHKLIHSGEKPHKCTQCDYATAQTGYLRDHIKTHSTEKPNQCNWCEFSSITKKILPNIFSPTVERRHITVKSAGAHSTEQKLWRGTSTFTLEKSHTSAQNVITQVQNLVVSESICGRNTLLW